HRVYDNTGPTPILDNAFADNQAASVVLGQFGFFDSGSAVTATGMNNPTSVAVDAFGNLWVADSGNNRVLEFARDSGFATGHEAVLVLAQAVFTTNAAATTSTGMANPSAASSDPKGLLY